MPKNLLINIIFVLLLVSSFFTSLESPFRYTKYLLIPIIIFVLIIYNKKIKINKVLFNNFVLYLFIFFINFIIILFSNKLTARFFLETFLIVSPIITALLIIGYTKINKEKLINYCFFAYGISFFIYNINHILTGKVFFNLLNAIKYSTFSTESWLAFPFGLFSIFYIYRKKYSYFFFSFLFFFLSFKRIALVSFIVSVLVYFLLNQLKNKKISLNKVTSIFVLFYILALSFIFLFADGQFSKLIYKETGLSSNHLTQGRFVVYNNAIQEFSDTVLWGSGLGSTSNYLSGIDKNIQLLHSDLLKIFLELGVLMFIVWSVSFLALNIKNRYSIPIITYISVLFVSDNVFIYFDTLFVFYIINNYLQDDFKLS